MKQIDKSLIENELWEEDARLFTEIDNNYISENEKIFFENLRKKMLTELAPCKELLISEQNNADQGITLRNTGVWFVTGRRYLSVKFKSNMLWDHSYQSA